MSFGVFSSRIGSQMDVPLELSVEHEHPDGFAASSEADGIALPHNPPPTAPPSTPTVDAPLNLALPDIPWSIVIPASVIMVAAAAVAWYMNGKKLPEIPI